MKTKVGEYVQLADIMARLPVVKAVVVSRFEKNGRNYLVLLREKIDFDGIIRCWSFEIRYQDSFGIKKGLVGRVYGEYLHKKVYSDVVGYYLKIPLFLFALKITDFVITDPGNGFGSILMGHLIDYAKKYNVRRLKGVLSHVDEKPENTERRNRFYKKFGFTFDKDDLIELDINPCGRKV